MRHSVSARHRVPRAVLWFFAAMLAIQLGIGALRAVPRATLDVLPNPPPRHVLPALALGEPHLLAAVIALTLQSFDDQPGLAVPFAALDYGRLAAWLDRALALDPGSDYPLLLAAQLYAEVPDAERQRLMLDFVHRAFLMDPDRRWRWLAHAAILARHRLHDDALALGYARDIAAHAPAAPGWARQMHILLLESTGEREQARVLLGALLASGEVRDPAEAHFLAQRLARLELDPSGAAQGLPSLTAQ